uniref:CW domain-containing protein n=1 Tax=Caenorhabditis tropicalis TaxID=1561998 RepID=A0A1I7UGC0_9PELO
MRTLRGVAKVGTTTTLKVRTWRECLVACFTDDKCYFAMMKTFPNCILATYGNVNSITWNPEASPPSSNSDLNYMAFKKLSLTKGSYSAYRTVIYSGYLIGHSWIYNNITCSSPGVFTIPGVSGCYKIVTQSSLTVAKATNQQYNLGSDGLMTVPNKAALSLFNKALLSTGAFDGYYIIGLYRNTTTLPWTWKLPELALDSTGMAWGRQPNVNE